MENKTFSLIWDLHTKWARGVLFRDIKQLPDSTLFLSEVPSNYLNFAVPTIEIAKNLDIPSVRSLLSEVGEKTAFKLFETHQKLGFPEHLIRNGFKLDSRNTFFIFNPKNYKDNKVSYEVVDVERDKMEDYLVVSREAFSNEPEMTEGYIKMELEFFNGKRKSGIKDLALKLFAVYEEEKAVAIGALFYSKELNFGYLHDGGTLTDKRGRGYQTGLLRHRINFCLDSGVTKIYVTADYGNQSWHNCIRNGFDQVQTVENFINSR